MRISRQNFIPADRTEGDDFARHDTHHTQLETGHYEEWYTVDGGISRRPVAEEAAENPLVRHLLESHLHASHEPAAPEQDNRELAGPEMADSEMADSGMTQSGMTQCEIASRELQAPAPGSWESHFFLAPNVRFTRTPDRHGPDRQQQIIDARAAHASPAGHPMTEVEAEIGALIESAEAPQLVEVAAFAPEQTLTLSPAGTDMTEIAMVPESVVAAAPEPFPVALQPAATDDAAIWRPYREQFDSTIALTMGSLTVEAVVRTAPPEHIAATPVPEKAQPEILALPPMAHLSDFAFWETVALDVDATAQAAPVIAAPAVVAEAQPETPPAAPVVSAAAPEEAKPESVAGLYRIIEWSRAPQAEIAPEPVAAAAPEPAPAIEAPAAAEPAEAVAEAAEAPAEPDAVAAEAVAEAAPAVEAEPAPVAEAAPAREPFSLSRAKPFEVDQRANSLLFDSEYEFPPRTLLQQPPVSNGYVMAQETLEQNAGLLESVLEDFGVRGEIIHVRPGPVVTLYEFEPAPGVKSSRVIGLADDIARSMSALSARVAVVPGRNVIGIELPNATRETVYFREMIDSQDFARTSFKLPLCLGKTIGGEPVVAELAKMPHLLVAGTTGSGKSVAINTMILSLLYRFRPEECRLIMVDPKMLELSIYDGIPHLLTPVVTDPKKAVMALKWAVREMEDRYKKMSRLGVRNIDGYNARAASARERGEVVNVTVQTGFDKNTGELLHETQEMELDPMPYIVVIVDEMADLMMVAGKEIEGAIQRLAQMARAAGIHLIMATQRPSVDVITGTIKANFPTRISFQVTSKIDSRTILGEQGAEQLLGQGDMLHMAGGGRIMRVHGPFVSDEEVEKVVLHLKAQGRPDYLETVTADEGEEEEAEEAPAVFDKTDMAAEDGNDLYDKAVKIVFRDKKCSTSYIQRRLAIGYNRAASLVERMEKEGLVGPANHVGKRELLSQTGSAPAEAE